VHEGTLGIHQVELVVQTCPCLCNCSCVAQHAHCTLDFSKISTWHDSGGLVVDANFKASWAPVNKLNGALGFDSGDSSIDIFGDDISTEEQAACHVFAMTRITFHHLVGWFKAGVGDLRDGQLLVVSFLSRDDRGVGGKREVNTGSDDGSGEPLEIKTVHPAELEKFPVTREATKVVLEALNKQEKKAKTIEFGFEELEKLDLMDLYQIVHELQRKIKVASDLLVKQLVERDAMHLEQDSLLTEVEDITKLVQARHRNTSKTKR